MRDLFLEENYIFGENCVTVDKGHFFVRFSHKSDWTFQFGHQKVRINHEYGSDNYEFTYKRVCEHMKSLPQAVKKIILLTKLDLHPAPNAPFYEALKPDDSSEYISNSELSLDEEKQNGSLKNSRDKKDSN